MTRRILLLLVFAVACFGQSEGLAGKWTYPMDTPDGSIPVLLDLKLEGTKVTGTVAAGDRSFPITAGTYENGEMKLSVERVRGDGGKVVYQLTGKLDGKVLKGTTTADVNGEKVTQEWEAKRP